ncbi:MAG: GNAT family N-acetyltransferase [Silicimonas sp.]|nr:GNAT family N-acetyltransferase [Silicimonas sp.]
MTQVARSLSTTRLALRAPRAADLPAYTAFYGSDRARFQGGPYTHVQCFEKFAVMIGHWELRGFGRYVIEAEGQAIGHVGPLQMGDDAEPELTWSLWSEAAEGHGYATEAATHVAHYLLKDCNWPRLVVLIQPENSKSMRVAEKLGARLTDIAPPAWYQGAKVFHLDERCAA